ncbi:phytoene desaturase family protein [Rhodomicrobium sp. Az07]|uniref:phytoene desaturase family protein n=1 Tax=Rhodomicrobium sp. Az07 TaxID=2839034 RepID=UPI0020367872|nr:phytoene desaturase family protein [Rhodomicrobium sp. Az07]
MDQIVANTEAPARSRATSAETALVVGAGFGGIAAALRLAAKGYRVTLIDRGRMLGGRAQVFEKDGFKHDAGPTVITAPFLIEELFELFGKKSDDYLTLKPLTPWYRFFFDEDGSTFDYGGTLEETLAAMNSLDPRDGDGYLRMLKHSKQLFDAGFTNLADQPFHNPFIMFGQIPRLVQLGSYRTVWDFVTKYFHSPKLRQALSIQPLLVGGSPFSTTSIYGLIHYLERKWGVFYAEGGTGAIVAALGKLMEEEGVDIRLGETVSSVVIENGTAKGVRLVNGDTVSADIVVSDVDPMHLFGDMIPNSEIGLSARLKRKTARLSMGLFVLYFGTDRQYPDVARHTIWLGKRYKGLLDDIFNRKVLADDFSLYVHRPTATDPTFAPDGCDAFYALCPVPNLKGDIDWSVEGPKLRDRIVAGLERTILPGLSETIRAEMVMTPRDFKHGYLSHEGAGFSIAPHFTQSAYFRFHNKAEGIRNLFLTGAGTHPGAGIPGVICSAKVIDKLVPQARS